MGLHGTNHNPNPKIIIIIFLGLGLVFLVSVRFCLSGVLRWAKISLAHFSGRTRSYSVPFIQRLPI